MRKNILVLFMLLSQWSIAEEKSASGTASGEYKLLFKNTSTISVSDMQEIFDKLDIGASPDGKSLIDKDCGVVNFDVKLVDLNNDKTSEIFIVGGNLCTSGNAGATTWLFIKNQIGHYESQFGFPAIAPKILPDKHNGFSDISLGGPGFCTPVWAWSGTKYEFKCGIEDEAGGCVRKGIETLCP